ncbi:ATP-binding protein [Streptomyces caeni]|uniref:ATP-binding protein n=1 Tax=Streptomyces caeni TaxID=2307231 RepID=A0ABW4IJ22_9ACTN
MSPHTTPSTQLLDTAGPRRAHRLGLPAHRSSVGVARRSMGAWLASWRLPDEIRDDAVLLVSELVTNAVVHTLSARILCGAELVMDRHLRIEVHDQGHGCSGLPPCRPGTDDESGRGLLLVEELAESWGTGPSRLTGGSVVWATLAWRTAGPATRPFALPS